ncbi:MAG: hypothetical protein JWM52_270 [Candidatus Saccharibacteria bacterium]|nr:hypothetical protein [Candidatus Saccharibacteria bacterium]
MGKHKFDIINTMPTVLHHQSLRRRVHSKKEKYPHPNLKIRWFDRFIILVGILNAVATIPQVLQIWIGQDATGVSLISWSYYTFGSVMFLIYGLIHRELPIIVNYSIALMLYALIVIGTLIYS